MAAGRIVLPPYFPARDRNARLVPGALLAVYDDNTTTKAPIYSDQALTTPLTNPVAANSSGQFPAIWCEAGTTEAPVLYSLAISDAAGRSIGNPAYFTGWQPSVDAGTAQVALAEAAAEEAGIARDETEAFLAEALAIQASGDDAAAIAARVLKSANGADFADPDEVRANIGADLAANVYAAQSGTGAITRTVLDYVRDSLTDAGFTTLQQAVTAASGKTLLITGDRVITSTITVPDGTTLVGWGGSISTATVEINAFNLGHDCTLQGLTITGPGTLTPDATFQTGNGVYASSKRNIIIDGCRITNWQTNGVLFSNCANVRISGNTFHGNTYTVGSGSDITFYSSGGNRHIITNNFCLSNNSQGIFYNALGGDADCTISGNVIVTLGADWTEHAYPSGSSSARRHSIVMSYAGGANAGRTVVCNNICRNTAWTGIYIQNATSGSGVTLIGNYCSNNGYDLTSSLSGGIFVNSLGDELIEGNYIDSFRNTNSGTGALTLYRASAGDTGLAVRNNTIINAAGYGMFINGFLRDTDITGNKIIAPASIGAVISLSATAGDHGGINFIGNTIIRRSGNASGVDYNPGGGTTRSRIIDNKIIGYDNTTVATWNTGLSLRNTSVEVRGNLFRGWYWGIGGAAYLTASTRYFDTIVIDDNTFETCNTGIGMGAVNTTSTVPVCGNVFRSVTNKVTSGALAGGATLYIAQRNGDKIRVFDRTAAPTTGTWAVGDSWENATPTAGGVPGGRCTTAGNPGTWKAEAMLAA